MSQSQQSTLQNVPFRDDIQSLIDSGYNNAIYSAVKALVGYPDCDDVYSEAWVKMLSKLESIDTVEDFNAWFYRLAYNQGIDYLRKNKRRKRRERTVGQLPELAKEHASMSEQRERETQKQQQLELADQWLHELPLKLRVPYVHHHVDGMSFRAIGDLMGEKEDTIRKRVHRAEHLLSEKTQQIVVVGFAAGIDHDHIALLTQNAIAKFLEQQGAMETAVATAATSGAAAGASNATMPGSGGVSVMSLLSYIALPLFLIASLFMGGRFAANRVVENATTLQNRRWIIKHLAIFYGIVLGFPLYFMVVHIILPFFFVGLHNHYMITSFFNWIYCGPIIIYLGWLSDRSRRLHAMPDSVDEQDADLSFIRLQMNVNKSFRILSGLLCLFYIWLGAFVIVPNIRLLTRHMQIERLVVLAAFSALLLVVFCLHIATMQMFRYFFSISENGKIFQATRKKQVSAFSLSNMPILILAGLTMLPSCGHLLFVRMRILHSVLELAVLTVLWSLVLIWNRQDSEYRMRRTMGTLVIILLLMQIARDIIFA